jgi:hypothetical protein
MAYRFTAQITLPETVKREMRTRTIILLLLLPLIFLWALGSTLFSTSEKNPPQKRQTKTAPQLTTHTHEEPPTITET